MKITNNIAFLDILFNLLMVFVFFFVVQLSKTDAKNDNVIESAATHSITMSWNENSHDDIDLHVDDPFDNLCFYRSTQVGLMHLERDDTGIANDIIEGPNGQKFTFIGNKEMIFLRGTIDGDYHISAHLWAKRDVTTEYDLRTGANAHTKSRIIPVTITVEQLTPYKMLYSETKNIVKNKEELPFCTMTFKDGKVIKVDTTTRFSIIKKHMRN